jgi:hypothetical protein
MSSGAQEFGFRDTGVRRPGHVLRGIAVASAFIVWSLCPIQAAECPAETQPRVPPSEQPIINIDKHKKQLIAYHDGDYISDISLVLDGARKYVDDRIAENKKLQSGQLKQLAIVLDIDETSLSNWQNLASNNFGFIPGGSCVLKPGLPCGFDEWILMGSAPAIGPTLDFFNFVRSKFVAVFFITGRRDSQRTVTMANLDRAGFNNWAGLATRPDDENGSIVPFKSSERNKIVAKGYTIIANIGDQDSDHLEKDGSRDGSSECFFKLPNPFYFVD